MVTIKLSKEMAHMLRFYLVRSYLRYGDQVANIVAEEGIARGKLGKKALEARKYTIKALDAASQPEPSSRPYTTCSNCGAVVWPEYEGCLFCSGGSLDESW